MTEWNQVESRLSTILLAVDLIYIGILGVISSDFGYHWDEQRIIDSIVNSVETGEILPHWYNYPSISFDIAMGVALPNIVWNELFAEPESNRNIVDEYLLSNSYKSHTRSIFFLLSNPSCHLGLKE